jgi:hypothetical protein
MLLPGPARHVDPADTFGAFPGTAFVNTLYAITRLLPKTRALLKI